MADLTLEAFQKGQARFISRQVIDQCEERERKMQASWQKQCETAHGYLVSILRLLDQDFDEACEKAARPLEKLSDDDLAYLIQVRIRVNKADLTSQVKGSETAILSKQLEEMNGKYQQLSLAHSSQQHENKRLIDENISLKAHLDALRQAQKGALVQCPKDVNPIIETHPSDPKQPLPEWMIAWQMSKTYDRTSLVVLVMGDSGKTLRPSITKIMARKLSLSEENNSLDEAINRLLGSVEIDLSDAGKEDKNQQPQKIVTESDELTYGLVEVIEGISQQGSSAGGNYPDVLRLTPKGKLAYQFITGHPPRENEFDRLLRFHSTPEHTILNIQAAELLEDEGYKIQGQVQEIRLSNGGTFIPDITAADTKTGEVIFIEVERDVHKDQGTRKQKWMNLYEASNGNIFVFCDNLSCQRIVQGEINMALGGLTYNSYLTNLHGLRAGKRSDKDGSIWLSIRKGK